MTKISFKISYHNGTATDGQLDMYDAALSLQGFARALAITSHALLNDGEVRKKGNRLEGGRLYLHPPRHGSFETLVTFVITNKEAIGASIAAAAFYDILKWTWSSTLGLIYQPQTPHVLRLRDRIDPFIGEIEEALEVPLELAHRPIRNDEEMEISIVRPRIGTIITLDSETLRNVSLTTDPEIDNTITGNVTRYNILSGFGRLYDDRQEKTISFVLHDDVTSAQKQMLTWSMHHAQGGNGGKLKLSVQRVLTGNGTVKRYLIREVEIIES
ncbi:MAG: hypothetical protein VBE63_23570 [Lamprobacter sp.]|uniref:DUF7946 domain-containing protein n=1 Tax=Lamprobacter sp. TaxID=3100796 RepID=UPI002B25954B|nr:hypothetical protein [Lamprobacter sp.]MEA3642896.1 hypothetical protein [Lamprobacter sp.]